MDLNPTKQIPNGTLAEQANYKDQVVSQYKNNPLIEALPSIKSKEEVIQSLTNYPLFDPNERYMADHLRFHMIQQLQNYFQPLPIHVDLETRLSRLIRQGYLSRNPLTSQYASQFVNGYADIKSASITQSLSNSLSGLTIIGVSGVGKSSAIKRLLDMPQVICHSNYKGTELNMYQITYLRLECPHDGSVRGLINHFLVEVDRLLGTDHLNRFGKNSKLSSASLISVIAQIARSCNIGILVIDEIQNLSLAKSGGAERMLSFFVTLSNSIGLPIVQIGTPRAMALFSDLRIARRGSGQGDIVWAPMKKEDQSWAILLEGMWHYQWIRHPTTLTDELNEAIYDASCGITDLAVKTFVMAQIKAITSGKEALTPQLIKNVAKENLKLVQPMLEALRSNNPMQIAKYGDINVAPIEGFIITEQSKMDIGKMLQTFQKTHSDQTAKSERLKQDAIVRLTLLGMDEKEARRLTVETIEREPKLESLNELVQKVYKGHIGVVENFIHKQTESDDKLDLRRITKIGRERGVTGYQALKDAGVIVNDFDVVFEKE